MTDNEYKTVFYEKFIPAIIDGLNVFTTTLCRMNLDTVRAQKSVLWQKSVLCDVQTEAVHKSCRHHISNAC